MMKSKMSRGIKTDLSTDSIALLALSAALIYGLSSGIRANYGILLGPVCQSSGVDYASVSFVVAVGQLIFGVMQPVFGAVSMKRSSPFVLRCGVALMTAGLLLIPFCKSLWTLLMVWGFILPSGTAALSFGLIMGVLTPKLPPKSISTASGIVTASSGVGSTLFSPLIQALTAALGLLGTMAFLSIPTLLLLPVSWYLCRPTGEVEMPGAQKRSAALLPLARSAIKSRDYRFLLMGFFTCGFHMAIIETHLYTQITTYGFPERTAALAFSAYGLATMIGAVISGTLCGRFSQKNVLGGLYASRVGIVLLFFLLPKTAVSVFGFAILLGLTGSATVPPTSGLTERLFGAERLAMLFGVVFFSHQIGSFFSAWLGGIGLTVTGGYTIIWVIDIVLCGIAAIISFKIKQEETQK